MKTVNIIMARIYLMESDPLLKEVLKYLKNEAQIRGFSLFRAISGFGESGNHTSALLDLSLNLPLAVEFFDNKEKVMKAIEHLSTLVKHEHIVYWDAMAND
jgi:PII-like signaling protein